MKTQEFSFTGSGQQQLAARIERPLGETRAAAVFAHCFTCSKDLPSAKRITSRLATQGFAVMSFDFRGLGHSHGDFAETNFSTNVEDLKLAVTAFEAVACEVSLLVGHSLGGAAVLKAAGSLPQVRAVATVGAPSDPGHLEKMLAGSMEQIKSQGSAKVNLAGRDFEIRDQFLEDIENTRLLEGLKDLRAAVLIMHSPIDQTVGIDNAAEIFLAARHPKSFVSLEDADHMLRKPRDAQYVSDLISSWVNRYIDLPEQSEPADAGDGSVLVSEVSPGEFQQDVVVSGKHTLVADEPVSYGGQDTGPTPYQFLAIGLGACTSMTIRMYAKRKGIALEGVSVLVTHDKHHAEQDPESSTKPRDRFVRKIEFQGALSDLERASLLKIADRCPVHLTLEAEAVIETHEVVS